MDGARGRGHPRVRAARARVVGVRCRSIPPAHRVLPAAADRHDRQRSPGKPGARARRWPDAHARTAPAAATDAGELRRDPSHRHPRPSAARRARPRAEPWRSWMVWRVARSIARAPSPACSARLCPGNCWPTGLCGGAWICRSAWAPIPRPTRCGRERAICRGAPDRLARAPDHQPHRGDRARGAGGPGRRHDRSPHRRGARDPRGGLAYAGGPRGVGRPAQHRAAPQLRRLGDASGPRLHGGDGDARGDPGASSRGWTSPAAVGVIGGIPAIALGAVIGRRADRWQLVWSAH